MRKFTVIIVDDERLAREEVKRALKSYPDFELAAEAENADEAMELIKEQKPDLLFLDIQMPEKSGFDLLELLDEVPEVVFTTAFDKFAVQAFEINALDYLVKPMRDERFAKTIKKIRKKLTESLSVKNIVPIEQQVFIKDNNRCFFVRLRDVYLIESMDNYARLYFDKKQTYLKRSLNQLELTLDQEIFFRINRTQIINTLFIQQIHHVAKGHLQISMQSGKLLNVSSRQSVIFKHWKRL